MGSVPPLLLLFTVFLVLCESTLGSHAFKRYKKARSNVATQLDCWENEHFVSCGPEAHCETTCENRFSPPRCHQPQFECTFPRCLCNNGYVRGPGKRCIRSQDCTNDRQHSPDISLPDGRRTGHGGIVENPSKERFPSSRDIVCHANEQYHSCGKDCEKTCVDILYGRATVACVCVNHQPGCICKLGYARANDQIPCVPEATCNSYVAVQPPAPAFEKVEVQPPSEEDAEEETPAEPQPAPEKSVEPTEAAETDTDSEGKAEDAEPETAEGNTDEVKTEDAAENPEGQGEKDKSEMSATAEADDAGENLPTEESNKTDDEAKTDEEGTEEVSANQGAENKEDSTNEASTKDDDNTDEQAPSGEPKAESEDETAEAEATEPSEGTGEENPEPEPSKDSEVEADKVPTAEDEEDSKKEKSKEETEISPAPTETDVEEPEPVEENDDEHPCPKHEKWADCSVGCEQTCEFVLGLLAACSIGDCAPRCTCKGGFVRLNGICINKNKCEAHYCPDGQKWNPCGNQCENTCENFVLNENRPIACPRICNPGACSCDEGYARFKDQCIKEDECKLNVVIEEDTLICGANERVTDCGPSALHCQKSCDPGEVRIPCTRHCGPRACVCAEGFVRESHRRGMSGCVPEASCPSYTLHQVVPFVSIARTGDVLPVDGADGEPNADDIAECPENEALNQCGNHCEAKCNTLNEGRRSCTRICNPPACACKVGFARNANGKCVAKEDCQNICGENEKFVSCSPPIRACEATCNQKPFMCMTSCGPPRCVCQDGFIRAGPHSNECIPVEECIEETGVSRALTTQVCGGTEEWTTCGPLSKACEAKCPGLFASPLCFRCGPPACACKADHVRAISGECVKLDSCPYVDSDVLRVAPSYPVSQTDCETNEKFVECGPYASHCVSTCSGPGAPCPKMCGEPACVCRAGTVRGPNGDCIEKESCPSEEAPEPTPECAENEIYVECGPYSKSCELACDEDGPKACPRMCGPPACVCKAGFVRESRTDPSCVTTESCKSQLLHDKAQGCPNNTLYTVCSPSPQCRLTCANPNPGSCASDRMCRPSSCVCDENNGFVLLNEDSTQCVHHSECPPAAEYHENYMPEHAVNRQRDCHAPKPNALECFDIEAAPDFVPEKEKADLGVRWYYNREKWACIAFNWRMWAYPEKVNCSGTSHNLFETRKACESRCQVADGPACSGSDSTKPIKIGRKLRARRVPKPFEPDAMPEESEMPLDCHKEGYGCPDGYSCRRGMHFGTCCNSTVEAYFADAYKMVCPDGKEAHGSDLGEYWRPFFGDHCGYGGLVCPSNFKCVEVNPLFAKCCRQSPRRKPVPFSGRPLDPGPNCKPEDCELGCYPVVHPDGCTRCYCPEKAGLPAPSEPVDCGEFSCPGHCPVHRQENGCYECRCASGDDKLVYWVRVPVKSDSLTIPHLCIDYPVPMDETETEEAVVLFNVSAGEWKFESLSGTVQIVERAHRKFLSIPELFHVKSKAELAKAPMEDAEEAVLSRFKRTNQKSKRDNDKSGRVVANSIPLEECPCGDGERVEISPWLNWSAFSSYDWTGSDLAYMVRMLDSARLQFDSLTGRNMPSEAELVLTNPFNKNERELINVKRVNRLGDVSVYDHGFSCYSVKGFGEAGIGTILQKWYTAKKAN